jgi:hypothetical protein
LNNNSDARFAIAGNIAKAKARMLIELAGGNNGLTHAHALEATAIGCGFRSWKELLVFNEKREAGEPVTPEHLLAYDANVEPGVRSARQRNQRRGIQKYLKCPDERARELARAWGLTVSARTHIAPPKQDKGQRATREDRAERPQRQERTNRPERTRDAQAAKPGRDRERRSDNRGEARGEARSGNRAGERPGPRGGNRPSVRPDPLVSGIFLSGGDAPAHSTLRVSEGESQVNVPRGPRRQGQGPTGGRDNPRGHRPNPLKSGTFLAREEPRSSMRELRDDDYQPAQVRKNGPSTEVTYKKRRTIEEQHP